MTYDDATAELAIHRKLCETKYEAHKRQHERKGVVSIGPSTNRRKITPGYVRLKMCVSYFLLPPLASIASLCDPLSFVRIDFRSGHDPPTVLPPYCLVYELGVSDSRRMCDHTRRDLSDMGSDKGSEKMGWLENANYMS
jgi:hypothetical protein